MHAYWPMAYAQCERFEASAWAHFSHSWSHIDVAYTMYQMSRLRKHMHTHENAITGISLYVAFYGWYNYGLPLYSV